MRDLVLIGFLGTLLALGLKRPFLFVLAYAYVDIIAPQRLAYHFLASIPLSMLVAGLALGSWLLVEAKRGFSFSGRQFLMLLLLAYVGLTTFHADLPVPAQGKWEWVWKALIFAIFLPLALRTRLRIESYLLVMILSASALVITGGIKTALSGGGYGTLVLLVDNNSGLYEGSTISTIAIAMIPLILWFTRYGTVFAPDWRVKTFGYALVLACLLIPVGTATRTGLLCIAALFLLSLRDAKRRLLYIGGAAALGLLAVPFLPTSYTSRMETIQGYQADQSAGTRLAVWGWTLDFVKNRPFGGGFEAYLQNRIQVRTVNEQSSGQLERVSATTTQDEGRAWHSAYFEMLGEQGFPGLGLWLLIHLVGLVQMERLRRRYRKPPPGKEWVAPLATALQHFQIIYLIGAVFVAIAFQPFVWMILGVQVALDRWLALGERKARKAERQARIAGTRGTAGPTGAAA